MPLLLVDAPTYRACGLTFVLFADGVPQIDLTTMYIAQQGEMPVLGVLINSLDDLHKLEHYVIWTPAFQQLSAKIMAMDMARMVGVGMQ